MLELCLLLIDTEEERERFSEIYNEYNKLVYYIAYEKLHTKELAEECVQETYIYIAKNFAKFLSDDKEKLKSHIATVAKGKAISIYRKEFKYMYDLSETETEAFTEIQDSAFDIADVVALRSAMEKLSDEENNLLQLKYVYDMRSAEIAKLYNISDTSVRKKIQRVKEKLMNMIDE